MTRTRILAIGFVVALGIFPVAAQPLPQGGGFSSLASGAKGAGARLLPGTRLDVLSTVQGNALSSTNGQLASATVRLRDARFGRVVDTQFTDKAGSFAFKAVDPGSYIVEIMGTDQTVLAASQLVSVNAGQAVSAVVKLPFRIPALAGVLGNTTPSAAAVTTAAAGASVLAATTAGAAVSPVL